MAGKSWVGMAKPNLETRLVEAVRSGDASSVEHLLSKGANVNAVTSSGDTAIGVAAQNGDVTIIRILLDFNKTCHSDATCRYDRSTKARDYCERTSHSYSVERFDGSDTNYCGESSKNRCPCHSDVTARSAKRRDITKRTYHSDSVVRFDDFDTNYSSDGLNVDKNMCQTDFPSTRTCYVEDSTISNTNKSQRTSQSDGRSTDRTRCHSDAVDNVRTASSSDKSNCGYFVMYHGDACEQDENENCNLEGQTPEGMDQLEWDVEVKDSEEEKSSGEKEDEEEDVWSCQYRWYADILERTPRAGCVQDVYQQQDVHVPDVNVQDVHGCTALHYAASEGHQEAVRLLIEAGCQLDVCDLASQTALHLAAARGNTAVVEMLADAAGKSSSTRQHHLVNMETGDSRRMTALHFGAARGHWLTCGALLARGALVNALDARDRTPLYLAVARGHLSTARLLLKHGANANIEQIHGLTAICEAVWSGNVAMVAALSAAAARLCPAHQLLHAAVLQRNAAMVQQLLQLQPHLNAPQRDNGETPLMLAARTGQLQVARLLLKHGAKANAVNPVTGDTALMAAVDALLEWAPLASSHRLTSSVEVTSSFEATVRLLVEHGADLDHRPAVGYYTPLNKLMLLKRFGAAAFLIRIGADVNKCSTMSEHVLDNLQLAFNCKQPALVHMIVYAGYRLTRAKLDQLTAGGDQLLRVAKVSAVDYSWLQHSCCNVWPLTHLCRLVIRKQLLAAPFSLDLDALPVPSLLKRFIRMEEYQVDDHCSDRPPQTANSGDALFGI